MFTFNKNKKRDIKNGTKTIKNIKKLKTQK